MRPRARSRADPSPPPGPGRAYSRNPRSLRRPPGEEGASQRNRAVRWRGASEGGGEGGGGVAAGRARGNRRGGVRGRDDAGRVAVSGKKWGGGTRVSRGGRAPDRVSTGPPPPRAGTAAPPGLGRTFLARLVVLVDLLLEDDAVRVAHRPGARRSRGPRPVPGGGVGDAVALGRDRDPRRGTPRTLRGRAANETRAREERR